MAHEDLHETGAAAWLTLMGLALVVVVSLLVYLVARGDPLSPGFVRADPPPRTFGPPNLSLPIPVVVERLTAPQPPRF